MPKTDLRTVPEGTFRVYVAGGGGIDSIDCEDVRRKNGMDDGVRRLEGADFVFCAESPIGVVLDLDPSSDGGYPVSDCGLFTTSTPGLAGGVSLCMRRFRADEKDHFLVI